MFNNQADSTTHYHVVDIPDAIDLFDLHRAWPERYPHLLQGSHAGNAAHVTDILFAFPQETLELTDQGLSGSVFSAFDLNHNKGFIGAFDSWWQQILINDISSKDQQLPFIGGWFVYLGYELVHEIEPKINNIKSSSQIPTAFATRFPACVAYNKTKNKHYLLVETEYQNLIEDIQQDIKKLISSRETIVSSALSNIKFLQEDPAEKYIESVKKIKRYILDGDVFQVNLSRAWSVKLDNSYQDAALYANLCESNPGPFAGIVTGKDWSIISSSPERLVSVKDGVVETRPIAGTRPRSNNVAEDNFYSSELLSHPKEQAEHVMLIDLERNDLGRVCEYGSIEVNELMVLESYSHVHHIVSNVRGKIKVNVTPGDVIKALFPGGTITGCPKVRCMEILNELEQTTRGPYTGSMGYINRDGSMDLNILIRTIVREDDQLTIRAGAGIVADSEPERELQETRSKAKGMLKALGFEV